MKYIHANPYNPIVALGGGEDAPTDNSETTPLWIIIWQSTKENVSSSFVEIWSSS